ncbi:MAG TPA: response regulator receiver protein, partial [Myxococcaceae bacterium]|nr:response regulator receiver protein [Myxococcaceae bacterium]
YRARKEAERLDRERKVREREEAERRARAEEEARARAEEALRTTRRSEAEERLRRTEAEARARLEAEEARRLEAEARAAQAEVEAVRARAEAAQAEAEKAQAQGSAEAELLASALREEAARRTRELAAQEQLRSEAEARAEREARARAEAEARAAAEVARLAREAQERQEAEQRARAEAEARATREREALAQAEREALAQAERAREQAHALEVEAAQLAERLAQGERAALEALARAEEALRRERAAAESLRDELAAARAVAAQPRAPPPEERAPAPRRPAPTPPLVRAPEPRPPAAPAPPVGARSPVAPAARLEWGAADGGRVTLEQLAALVLRLVQVRATARLELRAGETLRILWLSEGELVAAASTHPAESLLQRAVTDGLLDAATGAEARGLRLPDEALAAELVESGALRDAEVLPLLQRLTESRAVEALCEQDTTYLLSTDATPPTEGCAAVRPLAALLAEALHRGLSAEEVPARLHDPRAAPRPLRPGDLARFELSDRERRLLSAVDGERTVRELLTRAGVRQEEGLLGLWVAEVLGLLEVPVPEGERPPEPSPDLELRRLEAKWAAAMEADYFSVLGLPRTAGTDEVRRAHARLAREFDPLRYAGHSDPEVPARAARLSSLLDEAAQALSDERLRAAYARSLVDAEGGTHAS